MDKFRNFDVFKGNISLFSYAESFLGEIINGSYKTPTRLPTSDF